MKLKKLMFNAIVLSTLMWRAAAFAMTSAQYARMQFVVSMFLRKVMMGQTSHERHYRHQRTLKNVQMLRLFDIAPIHVELAVRRLRMLVGVATEPGYQEVFASTMVGECVNVEFAPGPPPSTSSTINR